MQQLRGLTARAPYFANGSAKDLSELVDFFDRRFKSEGIKSLGTQIESQVSSVPYGSADLFLKLGEFL